MSILDVLLGLFVKPKSTGKTGMVEAGSKTEQKDFSPINGESDTGAVLSVLVAELQGGGDAGLAERIAASFASLAGVNVQRLNQAMGLPEDVSGTEALAVVADQGRDLLYQHKADILIWGRIDESGTTASLRFITLNLAPEGRPGAIGVSDQLEIPIQSSPELEDIVIACVLAAAVAVMTKSLTAINDLLHDYALRIEISGDSSSGNLSSTQRLSVLTAIANIVAVDARMSRGGQGLEKAVELYRKAIGLISPGFDGPRQAVLHTHLADALQALSAGDGKNTVLTEQVVECFQAAIAALDESHHPQDWAQAHVRLGLALYRHGIISGKAKFMKEAVLAMRKSLKVYSKASNPKKWAEVMNHSGVIMTAMGEEINNDAILTQALKVFNETLEIRKREIEPILWAQTTNNLGAAAFALAKRLKDKPLMDKAAMAFEGAVDVYREAGQTKRVHVIEKNLNRVQRRLEIM